MMQPPRASSFRLKIDFAQASDPGRDPNKQVNEDSCGYAETKFGHLMVLCDGMGGHYGGKEASRTAITTIFEVFEQSPPTTPPAQTLKAAIEEAGRRVYRLGGPPENRTRPGSTVVAMLLHDRGVDVAHVGDSRAYVIRANQIYPLTRDHSMVQGMIDAGMLTEESAMGHPDSNKITRALGMKPEVEVEVRPESMELFAGDVLLQSSDGLTDLALGADILGAARQALASGTIAHACNMLVQMANDRGGHDNITVQMARVMEVGGKAQTTLPGAPAQGSPHSSPRPAQQPVPVTAPDAPPTGIATSQPLAPGAWGPVLPTATDVGPYGAPAQAGMAPGGMGQPGTPYPGQAAPMPGGRPIAPTMNEHQAAGPPSGQQWASGMYGGPPGGNAGGTPPPGLASFRMEGGAGALPLPPASGHNPYAGGPVAATPPMLTPTAGMPPVAPGGPMMGGMGPSPYGMPGGMSPAPQSSRGGLVFVIIGLSAVIAILIVVVLWIALR
jgi:serine/threonine protein phosphatase PrpC